MIPEDALAKQQQCPNGHAFPHEVDGKRCTPMRCAGGRKKRVKEPTPGITQPLVPVTDVMDQQRRLMEQKTAMLLAKRKFFGIPENLSGDAAESFIDKKLMELGVDAVAELEEQLKLGAPEDRRITAFKILDSLGKGKRDNAGGVGGPTVIIMGAQSGMIHMPWSREQPKMLERLQEKESNAEIAGEIK